MLFLMKLRTRLLRAQSGLADRTFQVNFILGYGLAGESDLRLTIESAGAQRKAEALSAKFCGSAPLRQGGGASPKKQGRPWGGLARRLKGRVRRSALASRGGGRRASLPLLVHAMLLPMMSAMGSSGGRRLRGGRGSTRGSGRLIRLREDSQRRQRKTCAQSNRDNLS